MTPKPASGAAYGGGILVSFLLVIAVLALAFTLADVGIGLARHGDSLRYGDMLTVPVELSPSAGGHSDDFRQLPSGAELSRSHEATLDVSKPTAKQMALRSAMDLGFLALLVAGLWLVRGFINSVLDGDPFGAANVKRLRRLGFLLLIGAPAVAFLNSLLAQALYDDLPLDHVRAFGVAGFSWPLGALLGGLGAFIFAEVFAYGLRLREDVEGTV
jgi:hypothetical protein